MLAVLAQAQGTRTPPPPRPPLPRLASGARGFDPAPRKTDAASRLIAVGGGWGAEEDKRKPRLKGQTAQDHYRLGAEYLHRLAFDRAIPPLERAVKLNPRYLTAYRALGEAYAYDGVIAREDGRPEAFLLHRQRQGAEAFEQARRLAPGDSALAFNLGVLCFNTGQYQKAVDAFEDGLRLLGPGQDARISLLEGGGSRIEVLTFLGRAYAALDQREKAIGVFRTGLALGVRERDKEHLYEGIAPLYLASGDADAALAAYQALLPTPERAQRWGTDPEIYLRIAEVQLARRDLAAAAVAFGRAAEETRRQLGDTEHYPPDGDATAQDVAEWKGRVADLRAALGHALYNAGVAQLDQGHTVAAAAAFDQTLLVDPTHLGARFNLGLTRHLLGDQALAREQVRLLQGADPGLAAELQRLIEKEPVRTP
jgi:tetratricopeptide (TPR) repeat protein